MKRPPLNAAQIKVFIQLLYSSLHLRFDAEGRLSVAIRPCLNSSKIRHAKFFLEIAGKRYISKSIEWRAGAHHGPLRSDQWCLFVKKVRVQLAGVAAQTGARVRSTLNRRNKEAHPSPRTAINLALEEPHFGVHT